MERRELAKAQMGVQMEAAQKVIYIRPERAPAMIAQSSREPDSKPTVSGDALTFLGTGTHATPDLSELVSGISRSVANEVKIPTEREPLERGMDPLEETSRTQAKIIALEESTLAEKHSCFTTLLDENQEEKIPSKRKNTQIEEMENEQIHNESSCVVDPGPVIASIAK